MTDLGFTFGVNAPPFALDRVVGPNDPQPHLAFGDKPSEAELAQSNVFEEANNLPLVSGAQSVGLVSETSTRQVLVVAQQAGSTEPISGYTVNDWHDKTILVLQGAVRVYFVAGERFDVGTGEQLTIPQSVPHTIMADRAVRHPNNERQERVLMMITYTPPAHPRLRR
jgi:quercetin dioxygenase-like cupin family protein